MNMRTHDTEAIAAHAAVVVGLPVVVARVVVVVTVGPEVETDENVDDTDEKVVDLVVAGATVVVVVAGDLVVVGVAALVVVVVPLLPNPVN